MEPVQIKKPNIRKKERQFAKNNAEILNNLYKCINFIEAKKGAIDINE